MKNCGIYLLTCTRPDGRQLYYVGQSQNCDERIKRHFRDLRAGRHKNQAIVRTFKKYGEKSFTSCILEITTPDRLDEFEQWWLDEMVGNRRCLNISKDASAPARGTKMADETKKKITESLLALGYKHTDEIKKRISDANKGKMFTDETRGKMSEARKTRITKQSTRKLLSKAAKEGRSGMLGMKHTEESKKKMSLSSQISDKYFNEDTINKEYEELASKQGHARKKSVQGISIKTNNIIRFNTMSDSIKYGFQISAITSVCKGNRRSHHGYIWSYIDIALPMESSRTFCNELDMSLAIYKPGFDG